jgi:hypothetical protein
MQSYWCCQIRHTTPASNQTKIVYVYVLYQDSTREDSDKQVLYSNLCSWIHFLVPIMDFYTNQYDWNAWQSLLVLAVCDSRHNNNETVERACESNPCNKTLHRALLVPSCILLHRRHTRPARSYHRFDIY